MASNVSVLEEAKVRDKPKDIKYDSVVVDLDFHPNKDVIATGLIEGQVIVHSYSVTESCHELMSLSHHKKACRALRFFPSGQWLGSVSKDKSLCIVDMEEGQIKHSIKKAHDAALYSFLPVNDNIVCTADEDGRLKVWDLRQQKAVMDLKENDDFISDMIIDNDSRVLVTSSGDGTLTAFDIRKHKLKLQSELFDSELLSLALVKKKTCSLAGRMPGRPATLTYLKDQVKCPRVYQLFKRGRKVVCGSGEGVLNIFNWGEWGNLSDRMPGHPMSVDCMVAVSDDIVCTGSMDGVVRAVNILPNRMLGKVGEHEEFPVENLSLSHCRCFLASCSHDQLVKFWNIKDLPNEKVSATRKVKASASKKWLGQANSRDNFFADLAPEGTSAKDDEEDESDESDDDSDDSDDQSGAEDTGENSGESENEEEERDEGQEARDGERKEQTKQKDKEKQGPRSSSGQKGS